jgi:uncharacterized protein
MDEKVVSHIIEATRHVRLMAATALGVLALFLLVGTVSEWKSISFIGSGVAASNTITVSGEGEAFAIPDTATFTFTVQQTAKDVATAQDAATKRNNEIIAYLKGAGIDEKDIQTTDYNVSPQYEWIQAKCTDMGVCPPGNQHITGFQVSQTTTVKVRDTKKAGDILAGVGTREVFQVSGLSFTIADDDAIKAQARDKAIAQAKTKADALAKSLGVTIVRIVGFSEDSAQPEPYRYGMGMAVDSVAMPKAAPEISVGQNKITSNVSISYEIR